MKQEIIYTYLGINGTLSTPIYLEGIYSVKKYNLTADKNKLLTKDGVNTYNYVKNVIEKDLDKWYEIDEK